MVAVGTQWGDEGKGKITDFLAEKADLIIRYQAGPNAGHTIKTGGQTFKFHHLPSGIIRENKTCILAGGMVIDPALLLKEMDQLEGRGFSTSCIKISDRAHIIMPYHLVKDELEEMRRGEQKIGTTMKGIGPAYRDKVAREGLRLGDMLDPRSFQEKLRLFVEKNNEDLQKLYNHAPLPVTQVVDTFKGYADRLAPFITETSGIIYQAALEGQKIILEGAQGTMLDLDYGTYPFVTSSNPLSGAACIGSGLPPKFITDVLGVVKAYSTRVGGGPFPTELTGEIAARIREAGNEYGTTTGRPRRIGWLDGVALRYAARLNGLDYLAVTLLDVLTGFPELKICTSYKSGDNVINNFPSSHALLEKCLPVWETMPGWEEDLTQVRSINDLPANARKYLKAIEETSGIPAAIVSIGPSREQTITTGLL